MLQEINMLPSFSSLSQLNLSCGVDEIIFKDSLEVWNDTSSLNHSLNSLTSFFIFAGQFPKRSWIFNHKRFIVNFWNIFLLFPIKRSTFLWNFSSIKFSFFNFLSLILHFQLTWERMNHKPFEFPFQCVALQDWKRKLLLLWKGEDIVQFHWGLKVHLQVICHLKKFNLEKFLEKDRMTFFWVYFCFCFCFCFCFQFQRNILFKTFSFFSVLVKCFLASIEEKQLLSNNSMQLKMKLLKSKQEELNKKSNWWHKWDLLLLFHFMVQWFVSFFKIDFISTLFSPPEIFRLHLHCSRVVQIWIINITVEEKKFECQH